MHLLLWELEHGGGGGGGGCGEGGAVRASGALRVMSKTMPLIWSAYFWTERLIWDMA